MSEEEEEQAVTAGLVSLPRQVPFSDCSQKKMPLDARATCTGSCGIGLRCSVETLGASRRERGDSAFLDTHALKQSAPVLDVTGIWWLNGKNPDIIRVMLAVARGCVRV